MTIRNNQSFIEEEFNSFEIKLLQNNPVFCKCKFIGCNFSEIKITSCQFEDCIFDNCNLSLVQFIDCGFHGVKFFSSKMIGINWSEAGNSIFIDFFDCNISHSTFVGLDLKKINIENCLAEDVDLSDADLSASNLRKTNFYRSRFLNTNLYRADLTDAVKYQINPNSNKIKKAIFSFPEAMNLLYYLDIIIK